MYKKSIFIFRRSLRISDNTGLLKALKLSKKVIPIFIFTPEQIVKNRYKSDNAVQFMVESLSDLDKELKKNGSKLFYFFGKPYKVVQDLIKNSKIDAVFVNADYTPYSKKRDEKIFNVCKKYNIDFNSYEDILLNPVGAILTGSNTPFKKYTPYYNKAKKMKVKPPVKNKNKNYFTHNNKIENEFKGNIGSFYKQNNKASVRGGRKHALLVLKK